MIKIEELPEGKGDAEILVSTQVVNQLIRQLNALIDLQITPDGIGSFKVSEKNSVLDFAPLRQFIIQQVQAAQNGGAGGGGSGGGGSGGGSGGVPPGGGSGGGDGSGGAPGWMQNARIEIVCNGDGTATGKLTF